MYTAEDLRSSKKYTGWAVTPIPRMEEYDGFITDERSGPHVRQGPNESTRDRPNKSI